MELDLDDDLLEQVRKVSPALANNLRIRAIQQQMRKTLGGRIPPKALPRVVSGKTEEELARLAAGQRDRQGHVKLDPSLNPNLPRKVRGKGPTT